MRRLIVAAIAATLTAAAAITATGGTAATLAGYRWG